MFKFMKIKVRFFEGVLPQVIAIEACKNQVKEIEKFVKLILIKDQSQAEEKKDTTATLVVQVMLYKWEQLV